MTYISRKVIFIIKSLFTRGIAVEMVVLLKTKLICSDLKAVQTTSLSKVSILKRLWKNSISLVLNFQESVIVKCFLSRRYLLLVQLSSLKRGRKLLLQGAKWGLLYLCWKLPRQNWQLPRDINDRQLLSKLRQNFRRSKRYFKMHS